jgi:hypothetical protein
MLKRDPKAQPMPQHSYFVLQAISPDITCSQPKRLMNSYPK